MHTVDLKLLVVSQLTNHGIYITAYQ